MTMWTETTDDRINDLAEWDAPEPDEDFEAFIAAGTEPAALDTDSETVAKIMGRVDALRTGDRW